jgi:hypothetical protein
METKTMKLSILISLSLFAVGCSEESMRNIADKDDLALSEQFIRDIQTGNDAGALRVVLPELQKDFAAVLPDIRAQLSKDPKVKLTLAGTSFHKSAELGGKPVDVAALDYDIADGSETDVVLIQIAKAKGGRAISMIDVNPPKEEDKDL